VETSRAFHAAFIAGVATALSTPCALNAFTGVSIDNNPSLAASVDHALSLIRTDCNAIDAACAEHSKRNHAADGSDVTIASAASIVANSKRAQALPLATAKHVNVPKDAATLFHRFRLDASNVQQSSLTPAGLHALLSKKLTMSHSLETKTNLVTDNQQEKANSLSITNKCSNTLLKANPAGISTMIWLRDEEYLLYRAPYWGLTLDIANLNYRCYSCNKDGITEHNPYHLLGCNKRTAQFTQRHDHVKFLHTKAFQTIGCSARCEVLPFDAPYQMLKPDIDWIAPDSTRHLFDVSIIHPHSKTHLKDAASQPLKALFTAAHKKESKYKQASVNIKSSFHALVFDTYGNVAPQTQEFYVWLRAIARENMSLESADTLVNTLEYDTACAIARHNSRMLLQEDARQEMCFHSASSLHL
jgi:hypothetical protein